MDKMNVKEDEKIIEQIMTCDYCKGGAFTIRFRVIKSKKNPAAVMTVECRICGKDGFNMVPMKGGVKLMDMEMKPIKPFKVGKK